MEQWLLGDLWVPSSNLCLIFALKTPFSGVVQVSDKSVPGIKPGTSPTELQATPGSAVRKYYCTSVERKCSTVNLKAELIIN